MALLNDSLYARSVNDWHKPISDARPWGCCLMLIFFGLRKVPMGFVWAWV